MKKLLLVLVVALTGCASTPPPVLADAQYETFATAWVVLHKCVASGYMTLDTGAFGRGRMHKALAAYAYDKPLLDARVLRKANNFGDVTKTGCETMAMSLLEIQQKETKTSSSASSPSYTACVPSFYNMASCYSY